VLSSFLCLFSYSQYDRVSFPLIAQRQFPCPVPPFPPSHHASYSARNFVYCSCRTLKLTTYLSLVLSTYKNAWMCTSNIQNARCSYAYCTTDILWSRMSEIVILEDCPPVADNDQPSKAQRSLHVLLGLDIQLFNELHHSLFVRFVWISEKTATVSLNSINWFVFITYTECLQRSKNFISVEVSLTSILTSLATAQAHSSRPLILETRFRF